MVSATVIVVVLLAAKLLAQLWLNHMNLAEVWKHAGAIPPAFAKTIDEVGRKFGLTRERIRQIQEIALKKLRKKIEKLEQQRQAA